MAEREPIRRFAWLFLRWLPSILCITLLTLWAPVAMGGMARVFGWIALLFFAPAGGLAVVVSVAGYAVIRRRLSAPIVSAIVLGAAVLVPGMWPKGLLAIPYPGPDAPSVTIRVPTDRPMRVYWGGEAIEHNYHALYPDQRWAYDLVVEPAGVGSSRLEDYGCYGVPVLAPIGGRIFGVLDGEPDQPPGVVADTDVFAGNHVVIELEATKTYLLIAHLARGSVAVKPNDRVSEGDVIGKCGSSGRTSEPHVHIHHQRQPIGPYPIGLAEGLPLAFRGDRPSPRGGVEKHGDRLVLLGDRIEHR